MTWDSPLTAAVARELHERLSGSRLRGHAFDWDQRRLDLVFRSETLRWSLHPQEGWVSLDPTSDPPSGFRPLAAELTRVEAPPDERLIRMCFAKLRGRTKQIQVVIELMTNQWNALLLEGPEGWIRHLLWTRSLQERDLVVGRAYQPPPPSRRAGSTQPLSPGEFGEIMARHQGKDARSELLEALAFTSPINLPELLSARGGAPRNGGGRPGDYELWLQLKDPATLQPCVLEKDGSLQPYPVVLNAFEHRPYPSLLEAFQGAREGRVDGEEGGSLALKRLDRAIQGAEGRIRGLEKELARAARPEELRERANLILARLGELKKGAEEARVKGFQGEGVVINLDPSLSPHENAEALYEEAARQERALERLPGLLREARTKRNDLEVLRKKLSVGDLSAQEVEQRLPREGGKQRWKGPEREPRVPYLRFTSSGGLEIRVGRGPRDNDVLTFRHSRPDDVWMHARDVAGAHVVLRWGSTDPPPSRDLTEAAVLAAVHSGARSAGVVPVDWTLRKHVRKPRKAPPGTVIPSRTKTLFVQPDPDLPRRLSRRD